MEELITMFWDDRNWQLALTTDKPVEVYTKSKEEAVAAANATPIETLAQEQKDWLRAT